MQSSAFIAGDAGLFKAENQVSIAFKTTEKSKLKGKSCAMLNLTAVLIAIYNVHVSLDIVTYA